MASPGPYANNVIGGQVSCTVYALVISCFLSVFLAFSSSVFVSFDYYSCLLSVSSIKIVYLRFSLMINSIINRVVVSFVCRYHARAATAGRHYVSGRWHGVRHA